MPSDTTPGGVCECGVAKAIRSALHEIALNLFGALVLARVFFFADRSGLTAQFETKQFFLQLIEAVADFALDFGDSLSGRSAAIFRNARRIPMPIATFFGGHCIGGRRMNSFSRRASPKKNHAEQKERSESHDQNVLEIAAHTGRKRGGSGGFAICIGTRIHGRILRIVSWRGRRGRS